MAGTPQDTDSPSDIPEAVSDDELNGDVEKSDDDILEEARSRFNLAQESESEIRKHALDDLKFRSGKQWPDNIEQDRNRDGRPCLVINRLPQFVQQVTNDQRQNRPCIKVHPVGDGADVETAKIIQGLIRHIEYNSNAEVAYDTAFESAVTGGLGYFRIITDFVDPKSFDQEIYIKRIRNPLSVFYDPFSQEPDGSDANFAFVIDELSKDEYKLKYPSSDLASSDAAWSAVGNHAPGWVQEDSCRIAEYFYKEFKTETIHLLSTGETATDDEVGSRISGAQASGLESHIVRTRETKIPVVKWIKMNGSEILEKTEWSGSYIPIIPVYGSELYIDGKRILESVIRHAKDPQRMYNYWASAETEAIALAPRTPFIVAEGQIEGYEEAWETANRRNHAYLPYKPTTVAGQMAPPPQRQSFEPAVQAITGARMGAADDMKSTTGIYDAALGQQSPDISGVAIQSRKQQGQMGTFHFVDNFHRSLKHAGRIIVDLIPGIYDAVRTSRIIADDGDQKMVTLNTPSKDESGKPVLYNLSTGTYDVTVDTGPSFASKRQEAAASMISLSQSYPKIMEIAGDLFVKNMDWPGAQEISDRIKKSLPPGLVTDPKQMQIPPQAQAQMKQMSDMIQHLSAEANKSAEIIKTKQIETMNKKMELEHDERIELAKIQADIEINMAKLKAQGAIELLNHQVNEITNRMSTLANEAPIGADDPAIQQAQQTFAPDPNGGQPAGMGQGAPQPTGGQSPGQTPGVNP